MMRQRGLTPLIQLVCVLSICAGLAPAAASAAAPANDAPAGAVAFSPITAENGPVAAQQGLAEIAEATADAGVPRCLGPKSFAKTVWFKVPASAGPQRLVIEAAGPSGASADVPDLAAYVQPVGALSTVEPQACDGAAAGGEDAALDLRVPGGREVLIQAGRTEGNAERIVLSLTATPVDALPLPVGDDARRTPAIARDAIVSVPLGGATLTEEDPAQPQCAAAGTVWRKVNVQRDGTHEITVKGDAVGAIAAFVGKAPGADNAVACANRTSKSGALTLKAEAKRKDTIWLRLGTDAAFKDASALVVVRTPDPRPRFGLTLLGSRKVAKLTRLRAQISVNGASAQKFVVRLQRRTGKSFVTVAAGRAAATTR